MASIGNPASVARWAFDILLVALRGSLAKVSLMHGNYYIIHGLTANGYGTASHLDSSWLMHGAMQSGGTHAAYIQMSGKPEKWYGDFHFLAHL